MSWNSARHGACTVERSLQRSRRRVANCASGKASTSLSCLRLHQDSPHRVGWLASGVPTARASRWRVQICVCLNAACCVVLYVKNAVPNSHRMRRHPFSGCCAGRVCDLEDAAVGLTSSRSDLVSLAWSRTIVLQSVFSSMKRHVWHWRRTRVFSNKLKRCSLIGPERNATPRRKRQCTRRLVEDCYTRDEPPNLGEGARDRLSQGTETTTRLALEQKVETTFVRRRWDGANLETFRAKSGSFGRLCADSFEHLGEAIGAVPRVSEICSLEMAPGRRWRFSRTRCSATRTTRFRWTKRSTSEME